MTAIGPEKQTWLFTYLMKDSVSVSIFEAMNGQKIDELYKGIENNLQMLLFLFVSLLLSLKLNPKCQSLVASSIENSNENYPWNSMMTLVVISDVMNHQKSFSNVFADLWPVLKCPLILNYNAIIKLTCKFPKRRLMPNIEIYCCRILIRFNNNIT